VVSHSYVYVKVLCIRIIYWKLDFLPARVLEPSPACMWEPHFHYEIQATSTIYFSNFLNCIVLQAVEYARNGIDARSRYDSDSDSLHFIKSVLQCV